MDTKMISFAIMLMLVTVVLGQPSYHQLRPSAEDLAQWEVNLGIASFGDRINTADDPELDDVVDPSLINELNALASDKDGLTEREGNCGGKPCNVDGLIFN